MPTNLQLNTLAVNELNRSAQNSPHILKVLTGSVHERWYEFSSCHLEKRQSITNYCSYTVSPSIKVSFYSEVSLALKDIPIRSRATRSLRSIT